MLLHVNHTTTYTYSAPVVLEPHILRLKPMSNAHQRLLSYQLSVTPEPAGRTDLVDLDGNESTALWFDGHTSELHLHSEALVETLRPNPFDYVWQGSTALPVSYPAGLETPLTQYRQHEPAPAVDAFAAELSSACISAQDFLIRLAATLNEQISYELREFGEPRTPEETLQLGTGSCRDLAVLFMAVARRQGFAARFTTGYCTLPAADAEHELHAWPEVYVPGGGWRGFDPSTGFAVADGHILVAAGSRPIDAATVSGSYRGRATSRLSAQVLVS